MLLLLFVSRSIGIRWCHGQELACSARNHVSTSRILDLQGKKTIDSFETFFSSSLKYGQQRMANSVWPTTYGQQRMANSNMANIDH